MLRRRQKDKFWLISKIWNNFQCFVPSFDLTIDEQLFPCKTRCPFIQHMPNKPDKFGIKFGFWLMFVQNISAMVSRILVKTPQETGKTIYRQMSAYG